MSISFTVEAELRQDVGKGASRRLRHAGKVPAIVYGGSEEPVSLSLSHNEISKSLSNEAFYSHILTLNIAGKSESVVLRDLQRHPFKPTILHADFQRVSANEIMHAHVPLHFINADVCVGVKAGGAVNHVSVEVEVSCLPANLPEFINIDLSDIGMGESVHLSEIALPEGVELVALSHGDGHDSAVAAVHAPRVAKDEDGADDAAAEEPAAE
ncbi:MAG: 50S ribosomal protein L25/general stress protein Ctc [Gammaproteobacteria bacterium]|nr:50S ribosomal protein L25/general stress protein Ctc [Gammaproteobacteria bacterium]